MSNDYMYKDTENSRGGKEWKKTVIPVVILSTAFEPHVYRQHFSYQFHRLYHYFTALV